MISQTAEYALRTVVYLGNQAGSLRTSAQISRSIDAPGGRLAEVLTALSRAGIVHWQRGSPSGFTIVIDTSELTILAVLQAVGSLASIPRCPLGVLAHSSGPCPLHERLSHLISRVEAKNRQTTISELLDCRKSNNLCRFPCISESMRVLVVEDGVVEQALARRLLEREGHIVTLATTGEEAVAAVQAEQFDIVFMDVEMPGMGGLEATRRIRALEIPTRRVTVVGLTTINRQTCMDAGMDDHLPKSLLAKQLVAVIQKNACTSRNHKS